MYSTTLTFQSLTPTNLLPFLRTKSCRASLEKLILYSVRSSRSLFFKNKPPSAVLNQTQSIKESMKVYRHMKDVKEENTHVLDEKHRETSLTYAC